MKNETGLFAQGDVLTDYSAAIKAIGAGRRGAVSIHQVMYNIPVALPENVLTPKSVIQDVDRVENIKPFMRQIMPLCNSTTELVCSEIEKGFNEDMARKEASRCLQCGLICYEKSESGLAGKL